MINGLLQRLSLKQPIPIEGLFCHSKLTTNQKEKEIKTLNDYTYIPPTHTQCERENVTQRYYYGPLK